MVRKQRDFSKEYAARIAKGMAAGKSRKEARGHGKLSAYRLELQTKSKAAREAALEKKYFRVSRRVQKGTGLNKALQAEHMGRTSFNRLNETHRRVTRETTTKTGGVKRYAGNVYVAEWLVPIKRNGRITSIRVQVDAANSSLLGEYHATVSNIMDGVSSPSALNKFYGVSITNIKGNKVELITNIDELIHYFESMSAEERDEYNSNLYRMLSGGSIKRSLGLAA